jgi:hypothetical protein
MVMKNAGAALTSLVVPIIALSIAAPLASAQEKSAKAPNGVAQSQSSGKPDDGIKVHGHWTIDVRNADGTLASHNEFENACTQCGNSLAPILAKQSTSFTWNVFLQDTTLGNGVGPCKDANGAASWCILDEVNTVVQDSDKNAVFPTLVLNAAQGASTIDVIGNLTASFTGQINRVWTNINVNTATLSSGLQFSLRDLATPIAVTAGQLVYVKVTFSFS